MKKSKGTGTAEVTAVAGAFLVWLELA